MNKKQVSPLLMKTKMAASSVLSSLVCILIGLLLGYVFLVLLNSKGAWKDGMWPIIKGGFKNFDKPMLVQKGRHMPALGLEIAEAAPLVMTGLSVAFAFKTGLFNIGAAGQYVLGAFGALICSLVLKLPWWVCLLAAALFGGIWGAFPGILKAYLNVNEVITCIMLNWVGLYGVNTIVYNKGNSVFFNTYKNKTHVIESVSPASHIPSKIFGWNMGKGGTFGTNAMTIALLLAIIVAVIIYVILSRTTFGYELKACGHNKNAAKYAGINEKRNIILSMVIAGALAGFGAGLFYLAGVEEYDPQVSTALPGQGFNGISVALLASLHPIGCIFSGIFIAHLEAGGKAMTQDMYPSEIADAVSGIIVYLCAFSMLFKGFFTKLFNGQLFHKREVGGKQ